MRPPNRPNFANLLLLALLYYVGVKLSLAFVIIPDALVMLWIPNGVLLAALLHHHFRRYGFFALAIIAAEVIADHPTFSLVESILFGVVNLTEVTVAFLLLRRWNFNSRLITPNDLGKFLIAGPIVGALIAALLAGAVYSVFRDVGSSYLEFVRIWWFSDATGLMIITPLVLSFWPTRRPAQRERISLTWLDAFAALLALAVAALLLRATKGMIGDVQIRPVWLFPFALYTAVRFGPRVTSIVLVLCSSVLLYLTSDGQQPFGDFPPSETLLQTQQVILLMCSMSAGLAALLSQLRANARHLEVRVEKRTAALRIANEQLSKLASTDALTGALNRRALFDRLSHEMERHRRHGRELAIVIFDIDHFKAVNDRFGHAAGDAVLQHVAEVTRRMIRGMDFLARYGGEEFVLVAPETDKVQAIQLSERIREALLLSEATLNGQTLQVTASFGVALFDGADLKPEEIIRRADQALYAAKAAGRNRVVFNDTKVVDVQRATA